MTSYPSSHFASDRPLHSPVKAELYYVHDSIVEKSDSIESPGTLTHSGVL